MAPRLVCYDCGRTEEFPAKRCQCGEPLWFETDPSGFDWPDPSVPTLWRFVDLLPTDPPSGVASIAGGTPLLRTENLDGYTGCRLWLKSELGNVTGSFKDRGSAVALAWAANRRDWVGTVSHGNMALSMAAHAAASDVGCLVLVPEDIPPVRLENMALFGPLVVRVAGEYGQLYYDSLDIGRDLDVEFVNSDTPLRVAGQKTVAFEIMETIEADAIVLPTSSGGHASAIWKALRELSAAGLIDTFPALHLVQAAACDPIAEAYRDGRDEVRGVVPGETIAYSIANPDPPSGNRALAAVRDTGGSVRSVDDEAIREAREALAARAGMNVEPASAAALAGAKDLAADGELQATDEVVVIATGCGFKEGYAGTVEPQRLHRSDLRERLPALLR